MAYTDSMSEKDKKQLKELILRFASGAGMIIIGIAALCNHGKTIETVSGILGIAALAAGVVSLVMRFFLGQSDNNGRVSIGGIVWIVIALLLFNTGLLSKLGKTVVLIVGIAVLFAAVKFMLTAHGLKSRQETYIPKAVLSGVLCLAGILLIINAQAIFEGLIVTAIGAYFIIHGTVFLYEWLGRLRYFRNFRGVE